MTSSLTHMTPSAKAVEVKLIAEKRKKLHSQHPDLDTILEQDRTQEDGMHNDNLKPQAQDYEVTHSRSYSQNVC